MEGHVAADAVEQDDAHPLGGGQRLVLDAAVSGGG